MGQFACKPNPDGWQRTIGRFDANSMRELANHLEFLHAY